MSYDLVIKNGKIVTAEGSYHADIGVQGNTIAAIGHDLSGEREIDASGKLVTPGAIDGHVHMRLVLPEYTSSDTFATGTRAAALGGTTAIVDFVECQPDEPMVDALARRRAEADPQVAIDYGLHMTIGPDEIKKLDQVPAAYHAGCGSYKLYMAYGYYLDDGQLLQALQAIQKVNGLPVVHAENWKVITTLIAQNLAAGHSSPEWHPRSRPALTEGESVGRVIDLARFANTPVHIFHVGCDESVARIAMARMMGVPVTGETCPQYLALTDALYSREGVAGALPVCAPPLRSEMHRRRMWSALRDGSLQVITTDHCPFWLADKKRGYDTGDFSRIPGGVPSIEVRFPLIYSEGVVNGQLTENEWVALCCTRPAKLFGFDRKGVIAVGYDADLVVFDPSAIWTVSTDTLHENCDWTPYEGIAIQGKVNVTVSRGRVIVDDGVFVGMAGGGEFVKRGGSPFEI